MIFNIEDYREYYNKYFTEFERLAVGEFEALSYHNDKPNGTCSSLESIIVYANYIGEDKGQVIVNAGAGASSWMFRKLYKNVFCTDPYEPFLKFVQLVCKKNDVPSEGFQTGMFFTHRVDHVYHDYGNIERLPYIGSAIDLAKKSVYVDDSDDRECCLVYRNYVLDLCASLKLKTQDRKDALDEHGRWGIIIEK